MNYPNQVQTSWSSSLCKLAMRELKQCPVCNALNSATNRLCYNCNWCGAFTHGEADVEQALNDLVRTVLDWQSETEE